jgi:hypothetical protein
LALWKKVLFVMGSYDLGQWSVGLST